MAYEFGLWWHLATWVSFMLLRPSFGGSWAPDNNDDVDRLCKKGGRGLLSVADVVSLEKHSFSVYVTKSTEPIMPKVRNHSLPNALADSDTISKLIIQLQHINQWRGKALHGQWPKLMDELCADSFRWLQNAYLKPVIESYCQVCFGKWFMM